MMVVGGRWWHWAVIAAVVFSGAIWVMLVATWANERPVRQELPVTVVPSEAIVGRTIAVHMQLVRDENCRMAMLWRIEDASGSVVIVDQISLAPGAHEVFPIVQEYIVPPVSVLGSALLHRRLEWECNWVQALRRPFIALEPYALVIEDDPEQPDLRTRSRMRRGGDLPVWWPAIPTRAN